MAEGGQKLDVQCSICFEEYDTPKVLTCGHTFCCQCLNKMLDRHLMYLKCPKCRKEVPLPESGQIDDLPTNFELMAIIDNHNQEENANRGASKKEKTHPEVVVQCLLHKQALQFYCKSCKMQVCTQCLLNEHKPGKHDILTKSDFAENVLVKLKSLKEKLQDSKRKEKSLGDSIAESENSIDQQHSEIQAEINRKVAQEQEKIRAKGDTLLKELAAKKEANLGLFTDLKTQQSSLSILSRQTEIKCTLLEQEFIKFNFSRESELVKLSKSIDNLTAQVNAQGRALEKTCNKTTTKEVDVNFHEKFQWDLGKLIPTAEAERLDKVAGGNCNCKNRNMNRYDFDDYRDGYGDEYDDDDDDLRELEAWAT